MSTYDTPQPWHRAEEEGNAQAWTYAGDCGPMLQSRGAFARELREIIADARNMERHYQRDDEQRDDLAAGISGMVYAPNGDHRFHADEARRSTMSENPHADTYAPPNPFVTADRGRRARALRAEIAHARDHDRPAHLPAWPNPWDDDYPECFPHMQTIGDHR